MNFKDRAKSVAATLKLDAHNAMPRFASIMAALAIIGCVLFSGITVTAIQKGQADIRSTSVYTSSFTTSKTGIGGDVIGVYTNSQRTRAMVLMKFDDVSKVSTDASNYQAFVTGSSTKLKQTQIKGDPSGSIMVFGSTGYMGIELDNPEGFDPQILNITVRANSQIVPQAERATVDEDLAAGDTTFAKFDQWRIFVNPGAESTKPASALDGDKTDLRAMYNEMVVAPREKELRAEMDKQLGTLRSDLAAIDEYTNRLLTTTVDGVSVVPPEVPVQIRGDRVLCDGKPITEAKGEGANCPDGDLSLQSDWTFPNGYNFDWRAGSAQEGYLDKLTPEGQTYLQFLTDHANAKGEDDAFNTTNIEWVMSDGSYLADRVSANPDLEPIKNLNDTTNLLSTAYDTYYDDKETYEVDQMTALLNLEVSLRDVEANHTINDTEDTVLVY